MVSCARRLCRSGSELFRCANPAKQLARANNPEAHRQWAPLRPKGKTRRTPIRPPNSGLAIVTAGAGRICRLRRKAWTASNVTGIETDGRACNAFIKGDSSAT